MALRKGNLDIARKIAVAKKIRVSLPRTVAAEATRFFKDSFRKGGFTDKTFVPWALPKRKIKGTNGRFLHSGRAHWDEAGRHTGFTKADRRRGTLIKSGAMLRSIGPKQVTWGRTVVGTDKVYGPVHNFGLTSGRANGRFQMPKRQFIGQSEALDQLNEKHIRDAVLSILNA